MLTRIVARAPHAPNPAGERLRAQLAKAGRRWRRRARSLLLIYWSCCLVLISLGVAVEAGIRLPA